MTDLSRLRILWTRPEGQGASLIEQLDALGAASLHIPLLIISPLDSAADRSLIAANQRRVAELARYRALIFISTNAVSHFQAMPGIDASHLPPCYAVGTATADAAADAGLKVIGIGRNSETLLQLPGLQAGAGPVLIVRGVGGRELMAETLRDRGVAVDYLDCYRRAPADLSPGQFETRVSAFAPNLTVAYSGETVAVLDRLLTTAGTAKLRASPLVVPGPRVAKIAIDAGFDAVIAATDAGTDSMLHAISTANPATAGD